MTTTTPTISASDLIIDALLSAENPLSAGELGLATGLPCNGVKALLSDLGDTRVTSTLADRDTGKVRVWSATNAARCAREAILVVLAEQGTEEALRAATRDTLRAAATAYGIEGVKVKSTKDALVALILETRGATSHTCACGEPVEAAGETCTVCLEAAAPAPDYSGDPKERAPRKPKAARVEGDLRIRIRKPDVALSLTDEERAAAQAIVLGAGSQRAAQRDLGTWLAGRSPDGLIDAEVLRTLLRTHGALNPANYTINAKKDGWRRIDGEGGALKGWTIPSITITTSPKGGV